MRVVLVEDDPAMQRELTRMLSALPNSSVVEVCDSAPLAIDWVRANPQGWDLAIVDIFLKHGHGFDVVRQCRQHALPHQRVVMLSNYARAPVSSYAEAAGADRFFDKSLDLDQLLAYCKALRAQLDEGCSVTMDSD